MGGMKRPAAASRNFKAVLKRDGYICQYCQFDADSVDHIIPYCYSLSNAMSNLVASCKRCNYLAGKQYFDTFEEKREYVLRRRRPEIERLMRRILSDEEYAQLLSGDMPAHY